MQHNEYTVQAALLSKMFCSAYAEYTQNNCVFPNNGLIKKFILQTFNIYA
jgi:hypothetical protein